MELHAKLVRSQLNFFKPLAENCSLELTRKGQDKLGELMTAMHRRETFSREHDFRNFQGAWIMPKDQRRTGVILYLHGGGYTCGSLEYAKGFASTLATECGVRVFCAAYRLAPEHPYPAALEDALESYEYLLKKGYPARQILLCGESAGGGLIYALCLKLKELGRPLPCGLVGISPWTDLTSSGASFETNRDVDPSMTRELLTFYAGCYTQTPEDPLCSPLFGDLHGNIVHRHGTNLIKVESRNRDLGADISLHRPALVRQRHESLGIQRRHMACIILVDEPVPVVAAARQQGGTYERRGKI